MKILSLISKVIATVKVPKGSKDICKIHMHIFLRICSLLGLGTLFWDLGSLYTIVDYIVSSPFCSAVRMYSDDS